MLQPYKLVAVSFPEGISSSLTDFIVLLFNIEVFQINFSWKLSPSKKKKFCYHIYNCMQCFLFADSAPFLPPSASPCLVCLPKGEVQATHVIFTPSLGYLKENALNIFTPHLPSHKINAIQVCNFLILISIFLFNIMPSYWFFSISCNTAICRMLNPLPPEFFLNRVLGHSLR